MLSKYLSMETRFLIPTMLLVVAVGMTGYFKLGTPWCTPWSCHHPRGKFIVSCVPTSTQVASPTCLPTSRGRQQFWNGTSCVPCTLCPPGFGLGTPCTLRKDAICIACFAGYDYSGVHSLEPCILCFQETNCLDGEPKIVQNCTVTSPPVCDGCKDNFYFNPNVGVAGGCVKCLPKCKAFEVEVESCNTSHDRKCVEAVVATDAVGTSTPSTKEDPTSLIPRIDKDLPDSEESQKTSKDLFQKKGIVIAISTIVPVVLLVIVAAGLVLHHRKKNRKERRARNKHQSSSDGESLQLSLLPVVRRLSLTLDSPVRDLSIDHASFIANRLNEVDIHGYPYWQRVAEKLGFSEESKGWVNLENPTKKLLHVFGEKQNSTVRVFIKALEEVDLTLLSTTLTEMFENGASTSSTTLPNP